MMSRRCLLDGRKSQRGVRISSRSPATTAARCQKSYVSSHPCTDLHGGSIELMSVGLAED
jgi:hypothetical protein